MFSLEGEAEFLLLLVFCFVLFCFILKFIFCLCKISSIMQMSFCLTLTFTNWASVLLVRRTQTLAQMIDQFALGIEGGRTQGTREISLFQTKKAISNNKKITSL